MSAKISFRIKEAYKKVTKQTAIELIKLIHGPVKPDQKIPQNPESIIIMAQERFGDIIVMTPLLKRLRAVYPEIKITVLGVTETINILKPDTNINLVCNIKHADPVMRKEILLETYDLLYNTKDHPSFTFMKLTAKIKAKHKVGIRHRRHKGFFNHMIELDDALPTVEKNLAIMDYLGFPLSRNDLRPYLPEGPVSPEIVKFISDLKGKNIIGINLSASNRSKEWGVALWIQFLKTVKDEIIVLAAPGAAADKTKLEKLYPNLIPSPQTQTMFDVGYVVKHRLRLGGGNKIRI